MGTYHRSWYTGDATANTWVQDFSPLVLAPPLPGADIALWPIIPKMADGTEPTKFEWIEEELTANTFTIAEDMDTTEVGLDITTADVITAGVRAGAVVRNITDRTKKELMLITSLSDADTAVVVRDYGGHVTGAVDAAGAMTGDNATGETHTSGDTFEIVAYLNYEGSSIKAGTYDQWAMRDRTPKFNYYSIIDDFTKVTASDLVRVYRGSSPDNWGYQLNGIKQKLDRTFERYLLTSGRTARSDALYGYGSMGGIIWMASKQYGYDTAGSYVTTASTFSYELWDDGMKYLYNAGGLEGNYDIVCLMPPAGVQAASYIHESALRGEYISETVRGLRCTTLMSTITGDRIPLVPCRNMPSDSFMLLNLNAVRVHFLEGRALNVYTKEIGESMDDYRAARLISEMTLEFHRASENSYLHTGVTYTRP